MLTTRKLKWPSPEHLSLVKPRKTADTGHSPAPERILWQELDWGWNLAESILVAGPENQK